ncbi:hypothetical protein T4D_16255 [Trichinella pseudospiralis]|uniref:Retrotransposon gag domain-containing protein n=1 Tax=Trichinella pseudospiralis TaxID=6337 RepID=A0A0V1G2V5_TRIPS|nr:hypothetical protein T4D_16255 [Trichinella pseudospiralis]
MSTRRPDRASEKERAQSDGADQEADPPAPPSGSLQWWYQGAYYCPPPAFRPKMDSVEGWLLARWSNSVRRELYPAGQARENSFEEFKTRLLSTNGPGLSTGQLTERFHALHQREGQTNEQYAQEVAEVGRRAGVSERDLVARFARGITSKQAYLAMRLQEPQTLAEARKLVSKVVQAEADFHQSRQSDTRNPKPEKTEVAQSIDALIHARRRTQRQPTGTQSGGHGNRRVLAMAGLQEGDAPFVNEKLNGTSWTESSMRVSVLLDTGVRKGRYWLWTVDECAPAEWMWCRCNWAVVGDVCGERHLFGARPVTDVEMSGSVLKMPTRRRGRTSEKEQAQSNGGPTGADPEADPLAPPGGLLHYGPLPSHSRFSKIS